MHITKNWLKSFIRGTDTRLYFVNQQETGIILEIIPGMMKKKKCRLMGGEFC